MSKARDLADFVSDGNPLADGTISVSEVSGAAPTASPTFTGDATFDTDTLYVDGTNNRVGIGTSSPSTTMTVVGNADAQTGASISHSRSGVGFTVNLNNTNNGANKGSGIRWESGGFHTGSIVVRSDAVAASGDAPAYMTFHTSSDNSEDNAERMRIDSSGNLLVGTTSVNGLNGVTLDNDGYIYSYRNGGISGFFDRATSDGDIAQFRKDGTTVGNIGVTSGDIYIDGPANHSGIRLQAGSVMPRFNGSDSNGTVDLGYDDTVVAYRFKDAYFSGTVNAGSFVGDGSGLTGVGFTTNVVTTNTTASANNHYYLNAATVTLTLPASPSVGDEVRISEVAGNTDCIIARNGSNIMSAADDITIDSAYAVIYLRYVDATIGWAFS